MNTTVEAMLTEILPKASVQELVERYGDPYDALFHAEESEWYDAPGMGNRGIAKLRAIKSIIKNVQNRPRKAPINVGRPIDIKLCQICSTLKPNMYACYILMPEII